MVAYCADEVAPAEGSAFDTCTSVVWEPEPSLLPDLTTDQAMQLSGAVLLLWIVAYAGVVVRRTMRS
jgi:hypothetical protein